MSELYIPAKKVFKLLEEKEAVLIDLREDFEVENVWIDRDDVLKIPFSIFVERKEKLPENKKLILCCAAGFISEIAMLQLMEEGHNAVYALKDGLIGWKKAKLPLQTIEEVGFECKCCCKE
jgi:rhodanese-related sulfurtransferase